MRYVCPSIARRSSVADPRLDQFDGKRYISLETFKKDGEGGAKPVWFVRQPDSLYVYTDADSWKVKRIRNNPRVRIALCNARGHVKGPWVEAKATLVDGDERLAADRLLNRKYLPKWILNVIVRFNKRRRAMIRIDPG